MPVVGALGLALAGTTLVSPAQAADDNVPQGCNYGEVGPSADALCWIDMSSLDFTKATQSSGQDMSIDLPGGSKISFTAKITGNVAGVSPQKSNSQQGSLDYANNYGPRTVSAAAFPTYGGAVLGNAYYKNTGGKPALWTTEDAQPDGKGWRGWVDHIELSNISVTKNNAAYGQYSFVMADAESTDQTGPEALAFTSDKEITQLFDASPEGYGKTCAGGLEGIGTTQVICFGGAAGGTRAGAAVMKANAPTSVAIDIRVDANSREAAAFAVMFTQASGSVSVDNSTDDANGKYSLLVSQGDSELGNVMTDGSPSSTETVPKQPIVANAGGTPIVYTVTNTGGTKDPAYDLKWVCTQNGTSVQPTVSNDGKTATVSANPNDSVDCSAKLTAVGPKTGPGTASSNPTTEPIALSDLATTPGKGKISKATFGNGTDTLTTDLGTWKLALDSTGKVSATFTPKSTEVTGSIPQVSYTVTDENGLTASSTLDVAINVPPTTGDASKTINPNQTATLTPEATPGMGEIVSAAFDNGSTTKDVPGEGTWTISVKDGQPVAVFTPVKDYGLFVIQRGLVRLA